MAPKNPLSPHTHINRVVITGGSGLLALNWACAIRENADVILGQHYRRTVLRGARGLTLDLETPAVLERQLREIRADTLVHTAGLTSVDECERQPQEAYRLNAILARDVAAVCEVVGLRLIHISTDHLFSGQEALLDESAMPTPVNEYARSKLAAEELVAKVAPRALIIRTNFFGWGSSARHSFSDWIIDSLRGGRRLRMFDDVFFTPILADALALTAQSLLSLGACGIYHVVGDERISKYDFGLKLARIFGLDVGLIERTSVADAKLAARRPLDMSLSNARTRKLLGRDLGGLDAHFVALVEQERNGRAIELKNAIN